jgi:2,4-dienoyl-CoA reductase-like NADH-dependent reductase (Old Yellow Enzyme family)
LTLKLTLTISYHKTDNIEHFSMPIPPLSEAVISSRLTLKNRIVKAAMEENLANVNQQPNNALFTLYTQWANGGVGLIITGNVMVDRQAMTGPGGVALDETSDLSAFKQWATSGKKNNTRIWMQINHPGRQVYKALGGKNIAPSAIPLKLGKHSNLFATPKAMDDADIEDVINRFVTTAALAKSAGFDGVQIHAAHGYLLAQFLSPLTNHRHDKWGGKLVNRARLLIEIVKRVKQTCGNDFDVSVKLNSADFQRGGFDIDDARQVINMLGEINIDVIELSGGSYEAPAMQGRTADERTLAREAYFLNFTEQLAKSSPIPLMLTGGIHRLATVNKVLDAGFSLCGIASALAYTPDLVNCWQVDPNFGVKLSPPNWRNKPLASLATMALIKRQLKRMSQGNKPRFNDSALFSLLLDRIRFIQKAKAYKQQLNSTT